MAASSLLPTSPRQSTFSTLRLPSPKTLYVFLCEVRYLIGTGHPLVWLGVERCLPCLFVDPHYLFPFFIIDPHILLSFLISFVKSHSFLFFLLLTERCSFSVWHPPCLLLLEVSPGGLTETLVFLDSPARSSSLAVLHPPDAQAFLLLQALCLMRMKLCLTMSWTTHHLWEHLMLVLVLIAVALAHVSRAEVC